LILTSYQAKDVRAKFVCSDEGTPAPTEGTSSPTDGTPAPTDQDSAERVGQKKVHSREKEKKSQYDIDREKNIEKNREVLAPFFEALKGMKVGGAVNAKKKERKKTEKKVVKGRPNTRSQKADDSE
jgi:hypothetical protein